MLLKNTISIFAFFVLTIHSSCQSVSQSKNSNKQQDTTKFATDNFFKQITQLDEFKQEQKRVDSIKKISNIPVQVSVDVMDSSFLKEDKGKNISLAFIIEKYPFNDNRTMYTIKFDKDNQKIISVEKNSKQFEQPDLALPTDTIQMNQ